MDVKIGRRITDIILAITEPKQYPHEPTRHMVGSAFFTPPPSFKSRVSGKKGNLNGS